MTLESTFNRWLVAWFVAVVTVASCPISAASFDWEMQRIEGRDYLPLAKVAEFYKMEGADEASYFTLLQGEEGEIEAAVDSRQILINGVRHWLGFPVIERNEVPLVSRLDFVKTIEPALRPHRIRNLVPFDTVVIDPGHGGHDHGAVGKTVDEKDMNLEVGLALREMLQQKGIQVVMTRETDVFVTLEERSRIANKTPSSILVSIHFNASPNGDAANGAEIFSIAPRGTPGAHDEYLTLSHMRAGPGNEFDEASLALATVVQHAVVGSLDDRYDRGVKRARFAVLRATRSPSVLVEGAFLTNDDDDLQAASELWRANLSVALLAGILDYRRLINDDLAPKNLVDYREQDSSGLALSTEGDDTDYTVEPRN